LDTKPVLELSLFFFFFAFYKSKFLIAGWI
jgi:hypothetical protein